MTAAEAEPSSSIVHGDSRIPRGSLCLLLLTMMMFAAICGMFGGKASPWIERSTSSGMLAIKTPVILRSGMLFEQHVRVKTLAPQDDLVIGVGGPLWQDMTINSMLPAPDKEMSRRGELRFHFGPARAGDVLDVKIDGQVNPPLTGGTKGRISWYDGERAIAAIPLQLRVLP